MKTKILGPSDGSSGRRISRFVVMGSWVGIVMAGVARSISWEEVEVWNV